MPLLWRLLYRLHLTPWDHPDAAAQHQMDRLFARESGGPPPLGRALDIGCGRGAHSVELARLGWQVTGIDGVPEAIKDARRRAAEQGVDARFVTGDVTRMSELVGSGFRLLIDVGCFHTLTAAQRTAYVGELNKITETGAVLLLLAFGPGNRPPAPAGLIPEQITAAFAGWSITDTEPAVLPPRLQRGGGSWYRLQRS